MDSIKVKPVKPPRWCQTRLISATKHLHWFWNKFPSHIRSECRLHGGRWGSAGRLSSSACIVVWLDQMSSGEISSLSRCHTKSQRACFSFIINRKYWCLFEFVRHLFIISASKRIGRDKLFQIFFLQPFLTARKTTFNRLENCPRQKIHPSKNRGLYLALLQLCFIIISLCEFPGAFIPLRLLTVSPPTQKHNSTAFYFRQIY